MSDREKILVTGGAGYIGAHVCKELAKKNYIPVVYDNLARGHASFVKWGVFERGDIKDRSRVREVIRRHQPTALVHLASLAYVEESEREPFSYLNTNISDAIALYEEMNESGLRKIIFSSSCSIYGNASKEPISENTSANPCNVYAATKLINEQLLLDISRIHKWGVVCLRYFNAAGADPDCEIGERHSPEPHVIPRLLECAAYGRPFRIYGTDYDTPDGTCIRDFVHVTDLARAHVLAIEKLPSMPRDFITINLGTSRGVSIRELVKVVESVTSSKIEILDNPRRLGDPPVLVADPGAATGLLGWRPEFSDVRRQIETAWAWFKKESLL